jgi:cytochrome c oxidase subunit 3
LLASGAILLWAHIAFSRGNPRIGKQLGAAALLGIAFVVMQGQEWVALLGEGLTLTSSPYGSFFYVIVGAHALHALAAIVALVQTWWMLQQGQLTIERLATVSLFWYFVVLVWPVLYMQVYL